MLKDIFYALLIVLLLVVTFYTMWILILIAVFVVLVKVLSYIRTFKESQWKS